jgi:hypothetical protein
MDPAILGPCWIRLVHLKRVHPARLPSAVPGSHGDSWSQVPNYRVDSCIHGPDSH